MRDFLGQAYAVGDYVAAGGGGNTKGEYGMILYKVTGIDGDKLKMVRLTCRYISGGPEVKFRNSTVTKLTKYVRVTPPADVTLLFERVIAKTHSAEDSRRVATWLHGTQIFGE